MFSLKIKLYLADTFNYFKTWTPVKVPQLTGYEEDVNFYQFIPVGKHILIGCRKI